MGNEFDSLGAKQIAVYVCTLEAPKVPFHLRVSTRESQKMPYLLQGLRSAMM